MHREPWQAIFFDASGTLFHDGSDFATGVEVFSDAQRVVECLRKRQFAGRQLKTALVTNWGVRVHQVLRDLHMTDCFDVVVCANDVEHGKPSPEPFALAADSVGVALERCVHIGDSLRDDFFGSFDAGCDSFWINRRHRELLPQEKRMIQAVGHPIFNDLEEAREYWEQLIREGVR